MNQDLDLTSLNNWLSDYINFEREPNKNLLNLSTMEKLCAYFNHPETSCPCFHVAGSKGKGTISANLAGILDAAGFTVGLYMSPHVLHFTERVRSAAGPFPEDIYQAAEDELKTGVTEMIALETLSKDTLTWFELVTLFAMLVFKKAKVDYAVYEVGMGGRLDTTNIIKPKCIAMGPIELEHTEYLGNTLAEIASEKAGVFKPGVPVISAPQPDEVVEVFERIARANTTTVTYVSNGDYQSVDVKIAELATKTVLPDISNETIVSGLSRVTLPARYEIIHNVSGYRLPYILLDGAHTVNSIKAVISRIKKDGIHGNLVFGCVSDKNVGKMAEIITKTGIFNKIYLTKPGDFKESNLGHISEAFSENDKVQLVDPDFKHAIKKALIDSSADQVPMIAFGSFYLAGEVKKIIKK